MIVLYLEWWGLTGEEPHNDKPFKKRMDEVREKINTEKSLAGITKNRTTGKPSSEQSMHKRNLSAFSQSHIPP